MDIWLKKKKSVQFTENYNTITSVCGLNVLNHQGNILKQSLSAPQSK